RIKPRTVIRETIDDLVDRLFGGETFPLMKHLIEQREISDEELEQLRHLVNRLEKESDDDS
ncbi:MAG: BlaI/MecI/CopY family transcriptional regulator, partial [Pirellulales bacterium]|nr:BlaI/MecI/CopY family transcriptional regulator [Pirellulales bacterium]